MPRKTAANKARAAVAARNSKQGLDASSKRKAVDGNSQEASSKKPRYNGRAERSNAGKLDEAKRGIGSVEPPTSKPNVKNLQQSEQRPQSKHAESASRDQNEKDTGDSLGAGTHALDITFRKPGEARDRPSLPLKAIEGGTVILPPEADDLNLRSDYYIHTLAIAPGAKIENRVRNAVKVLKESRSTDRNRLLAVTSMGKAANKSISVVEIAKRELLASTADVLYQYTGCWMRLETQKVKNHAPKTSQTMLPAHNWARMCPEVEKQQENMDVNLDDSESGFEAINIAETQKVRNAPCLVVYLSRESVPRLKEKYGEQVHRNGKS